MPIGPSHGRVPACDVRRSGESSLARAFRILRLRGPHEHEADKAAGRAVPARGRPCLSRPHERKEVDTLITDITEAIGRMGTNVVADNKAFGEVPKADDFYSKVFLQRVNMWKVSDAIKCIFLGPSSVRW